MTPGERGIDLIKRFEGFEPRAYRDAVGIPTIGYGNTYYPDTGERVRMTDPPISEREADAMLRHAVQRYADAIDRYAQVPLTQPQFDALVSWAYNVGIENTRKSTLMRRLNEGDYRGAAYELLRWNRAGGRPLKGLTRRREAERELFLEGTE